MLPLLPSCEAVGYQVDMVCSIINFLIRFYNCRSVYVPHDYEPPGVCWTNDRTSHKLSLARLYPQQSILFNLCAVRSDVYFVHVVFIYCLHSAFHLASHAFTCFCLVKGYCLETCRTASQVALVR